MIARTITVRVFFDRNSDQRRNRTEAGLSGFHVTAKGLRDSANMRMTAVADTDSKGVVRFITYVDHGSTSTGSAAISVSGKDQYRCLNFQPNDQGAVAAQASPVVEFAMVDYLIISGMVVHPYTLGSTSFSGGLIERLVYDDLNGNSRHDRGEPGTYTDLDGWYHLTLRAGMHTLRVAAGDDWIAAPTSSMRQTFRVRPGAAADDRKDFDLAMKNPVIIDVLAGYTEAAADFESFDEGIQQHIVNMFSIANDVYANSNTNVQLRLAGSIPTTYVESGDIKLDLTRMHNLHDGRMDDLAAARDAAHADLLTLISGPDFGEVGPSDDDNFSGLAYEYQPAFGNSDQLVFSVVRLANSPEDGMTLAHEIGHNLGAGHDLANSGDETLIADYAHGYRFRGTDGQVYKDVMAYGTGETLPFFSTPLIKFAGKPIGNANTADNARVIRLVAPDVSGYR